VEIRGIDVAVFGDAKLPHSPARPASEHLLCKCEYLRDERREEWR
jgi:hypothetical protein